MGNPFLDQCFNGAQIVLDTRHTFIPLIQVRHTRGQGGVNAARLLDRRREFRRMRRGQRDHRYAGATLRLGHMHTHGAMRA